MRMRGSLAGPELVITLAPGLSLLVPDGTRPGAPGVADAGALAGLLAGPSVPHPTGVRAGPARVFWGGLGLWLAVHEPRSCRLNEELSPGDQGGLLTAAPLRGAGRQGTLGIAERGGLAILTADLWAGAEPGPSAQRVNLETAVLGTAGFGPRGAPLAADLAAQVRAWDQAGRPGLPGLHVDAYPRSAGPDPAAGALIIERPGTRFAVYHD